MKSNLQLFKVLKSSFDKSRMLLSIKRDVPEILTGNDSKITKDALQINKLGFNVSNLYVYNQATNAILNPLVPKQLEASIQIQANGSLQTSKIQSRKSSVFVLEGFGDFQFLKKNFLQHIEERKFNWTLYDPSIPLLEGLIKKELLNQRKDINKFVIDELVKDKATGREIYFVTLNFPLRLIQEETFEHLNQNQIKSIHISPILNFGDIRKFNKKVIDLYNLHLKVNCMQKVQNINLESADETFIEEIKSVYQGYHFLSRDKSFLELLEHQKGILSTADVSLFNNPNHYFVTSRRDPVSDLKYAEKQTLAKSTLILYEYYHPYMALAFQQDPLSKIIDVISFMSLKSLKDLYTPGGLSIPSNLKALVGQSVLPDRDSTHVYPETNTKAHAQQTAHTQILGSLKLDETRNLVEERKNSEIFVLNTKRLYQDKTAVIETQREDAKPPIDPHLPELQLNEANAVNHQKNEMVFTSKRKGSLVSLLKLPQDQAITIPIKQSGNQPVSNDENISKLREELHGFRLFKALTLTNLICGVLTVISAIFSIVYFMILQMNIKELGITSFQFDFLNEFVVLAIHWIFHFLAAILGLVAIMNQSFCTLKFFVIAHVLSILLLLAGSGLVINYRIKNYNTSFTYLDIVLYFELGLLITSVAICFPTYWLLKTLKRNLNQTSQV